MTSNLQRSPAETRANYPIYTVRWLAIHSLGVPTVWFLGALASMQFIGRSDWTPLQFQLNGGDARVLLVLAPLAFSVAWNLINFGKSTFAEVKRIVTGTEA